MLFNSMLRISSSTNSPISATQIMVEFDGVDNSDGYSNNFDRKFAS